MSDVHRNDVELFRGLEPVLGSDVTVLLLERLPPPPDDLVTRPWLEAYLDERCATKADLAPLATRAYLDENFPTKAYLHEHFATKAYLDENFATKAYLHENFATKAYLHENFATKDDLAVQTAELKAFVHETVGGAIGAQTRTLLFGLCGVLTTIAALVASFTALLT